MEARIRAAVAEILHGLGAADTAFAVERPTEPAHGDYATNAALVAFSRLRIDKREELKPFLAEEAKDVSNIIPLHNKFSNTQEFAKHLAEQLEKKLGDSATDVQVAGPGFINIRLSKGAVHAAIAEAGAQGDAWGRNASQEGKSIIVEYANPNPFKEMHIGHLMSAVIGEAISRLVESSGARIFRSSFGGDVGPHVAKALWGLTRSGPTDISNAKEIGEAYARASHAYESDEAARKEIDELNVRIYDVVGKHGDAMRSPEDAQLLALWSKGREISMAEFKRIFLNLGTKLDYDFFDSDTTEIGLRTVRDGVSRGVFEESEGAVIYPGEKKGLHTLVFITSRGTPTYETKDIGLAFLKEERFPSDASIIVTSVEQIGHFKIVLAALSEIAPNLAEKTQHVPHGLLRLTTGKMSSREGTVITAADFIRSVIEKAAEKNPDPLIAEQVAVGAIKYMVLRQAPGSDIIFDPEKSLSLSGDSGPYLQYALVRACKILAYESEGAGGAEEPAEPYAIERLILHYPEVVARASRELAPNLLANYLLELAGAWNAFYATEQVLGSPEETYKQRVARAFANTMSNGLALLGIPAPEKM